MGVGSRVRVRLADGQVRSGTITQLDDGSDPAVPIRVLFDEVDAADRDYPVWVGVGFAGVVDVWEIQ